MTVKLLPAQRVEEKVAGEQVSGSTVTVVVAVAEQPALVAVRVNVSVADSAVVNVFCSNGVTRFVASVQAYAILDGGVKVYILPLAGAVVFASFAVEVLTVFEDKVIL